MHLYKTYVEKEKGEIKNVSFVKEGFVLPAFLFTIIYTLCYRLWIASGLIFLSFIAIILVSKFVDAELAFALGIGLALYTGLNFANWRVKKLERNKKVDFRGYNIGKNREDARIKFFEELNKNG